MNLVAAESIEVRGKPAFSHPETCLLLATAVEVKPGESSGSARGDFLSR